MQNIGISFVKLGQYSDAVTSFEHIVEEKAGFQAAFNLLLCYYALNDRDKMKKTFQKLLSVNMGVDDEDKYTTSGVCVLWRFIRNTCKRKGCFQFKALHVVAQNNYANG